MAASPLKVLLFLLGGSGAVGATAYVSGVLDPWLKGEQSVAAGLAGLVDAATAPDEAAPKGERVGTDEPATPPAAPAEAAAPAEEPKPAEVAALAPPEATVPPAETPPAAPEAAIDNSIPSFDIVRVEPDGSIVIAGRASPEAYVEVLTADKVIAADAATKEGDFAAIPDERLKPGDHQITLRAIAPGNIITLSEETALVSIPEDPAGTVLAMVEKPGEASKIISLPAAVTPPVEVTPPAEVAAAPEAAAEEPKPAAEAVAEAPAAPEPEQPAGEQAVAAADPAVDQPEDVAKPAGEATTPPAAAEAEVAAVAPDAAEPAKPAPEPAKPQAPAVRIAVEAVEIDGRKIFVAGAAEAKLPIRVYANEDLLGETTASPEGRFLVEAERDLAVGNYIIRADALAADGSVIARVAVPFEREPGEVVAAVAPPAKQPEAAAAAPEPAKEPEAAAAAPEPAKEAGAGATPEPEPAKEPEAAAPEPAKEPETAAAAPDPAKQPEVASAPEPAAPAKEPEVAAAPEPSAPAKQPDVAGDAAAPAAPEKAPETAAAPEPAPGAPAKGPEVAAADPAAPKTEGELELPKLETEIAAAPPETLAPKLESSASGVIIRRGDTLWRISKRVYGRGVRYSTIYLANQEQIEDPDRIWPGQVFKVPGSTKEGEPADMTAVGEQATAVQ